MTPHQSNTLAFIRSYWAECEIGPTYDEIKDYLGLKSKSGAFRLVDALVARGLVEKNAFGIRSVRPVGYCPTCGKPCE